MKRFLLSIIFSLFVLGSAAEKPSLYKLLTLDPDYRIYAEAFERAGLREIIDSPGSYTLFVPIDEVLDELLLLFDDPEALEATLKRHVVEGALSRDALEEQTTITALDGSNLSIELGETLTIEGVSVFGGHIPGSNGFSHFINQVLPSKATMSKP